MSIKYFLDTAIDGCFYWAVFRNPIRDEEGNLISIEVKDGGKENEPVKNSWLKIDSKKILKGRKMLVDGEVKVSREHAIAFVGSDDDWNYDIFDADCLIQAVYFGEIVYG